MSVSDAGPPPIDGSALATAVAADSSSATPSELTSAIDAAQDGAPRGIRKQLADAPAATATSALWRNLSIVALCAVAALLLGALTLRRRTP